MQWGGVTPVSTKVNCSCRVTAAAATGQPPLPEKGYYCCCRGGNILITFLTAQGCASKRSRWEKARKWCCAAVPHTASPLDPTTPLPSYLLDPPVCRPTHNNAFTGNRHNLLELVARQGPH